jgi:two-component system, NarL family, nitrate/nitrite response regulator NarL
MPAIEVFIVDPRQLSREGLRLLLSGETSNVTGAASSLRAALAAIEAGARPDMLVVVMRDSGENLSSETLQLIRAVVPECKVVVIANTMSSSLTARANEWGANAVLHSDIAGEDLARSLRLVMQGQPMARVSSAMQPSNRDEDSCGAAQIAAFRLVGSISAQEGRVLRHLLSGESNKMIARELGINDVTVREYIRALMRKLNVHNRTQVALWAAANGISQESGPGFPGPQVALNPAAAPRGEALSWSGR